MRLRADPYPVFEADDSALSLHGRRRWRGGAGKARSKAKDLVRAIRKARLPDGSWGGRSSTTIQRLWELWLPDGPNRTTDCGVDFLMEHDLPSLCQGEYAGMFFRNPGDRGGRLRKLTDVPFTPGCGGFVQTGAAMFFACEFGQADHPKLRQAYASATKLPAVRGGKFCSASCGQNIFQGIAAHPRHSRHRAVGLHLDYLARMQKPTGSFDGGLPFFPVYWGLSRLPSRKAAALFDKASERIISSQGRDGSWGKRQVQLRAFLVLDALARKKIEVDVA